MLSWGGGIAAAFDTASVVLIKSLNKDVFETALEMAGGKAKYFGKLGAGVAIWAAIGAGINAFRHRNDDIDALAKEKEQKEQEAKKAE